MLISVVILSVVILGLAGLAYQVARRTTRATDQALTMGLLLAKVDAASTVPYDSLPLLVGCDSTQVRRVWSKGCVSVDSLSNVRKRVRIVVSTNVPGGRPDTIVFERGRVRYPIPLK